MSTISQATSRATNNSQSWSAWLEQHGRLASVAGHFTSSVGGLITGNPFLTAFGIAGLADSYFRAQHPPEAKDLHTSSQTLTNLVQTQKKQIQAKDQSIQKQKTEIERLIAINAELSEKNQQLEQAQHAFGALNEEYIRILEEQKKQIEENRGILSIIRGVIQGYDQKKEQLLAEIKENQELRKRLQSEIRSLLATQKTLLAEHNQLTSDHNTLLDDHNKLLTDHNVLLVKHKQLDAQLKNKVTCLRPPESQNNLFGKI